MGLIAKIEVSRFLGIVLYMEGMKVSSMFREVDFQRNLVPT